MATYVPAKKNTAYIFYVGLPSQSNALTLQANPTLAAGDVKVAIDDGAPANLATIPVVDADFTKRVKVSLSSDEMNGNNITVIFSDAAGAEWCDLIINIQTAANQIDDVKTTADAIETDTQNIQGRIPAALSSGNIKADVLAISTSTTAADNLEASAETIVTGTVSHDNTAATTTVFYSDDITEATADHYNSRIVIFTSGDLIYQATDITDYSLVSGEGKFSVGALTEAPADNVTFVII